METTTSEERGRRQPKSVAGEIRKRKGGKAPEKPEDNDTAAPPPGFIGRKIGGARDFLRHEDPDLLQRQPDEDGLFGLEDIASIDARLSQRLQTEGDTDNARAANPLAAPRGWRRYWGRVRPEFSYMPSIWVGEFCKHCYEAGLAAKKCRVKYESLLTGAVPTCSGRNSESAIASIPPAREDERMNRTLFLITFQARLLEDPIDSEAVRLLLYEWRAVQGTPREIPTSNARFSAIPRVLEGSVTSRHMATVAPTNQSLSLDLHKERVKEYFAMPPPLPKRRGRLHVDGAEDSTTREVERLTGRADDTGGASQISQGTTVHVVAEEVSETGETSSSTASGSYVEPVFGPLWLSPEGTSTVVQLQNMIFLVLEVHR